MDKKILLELIAEGQIVELITILKEQSPIGLLDEIVAIEARYRQYLKDEMHGVKSSSDLGVEIANIRRALSNQINLLDQKPAKRRKEIIPIITYLSILGILAIFAFSPAPYVPFFLMTEVKSVSLRTTDDYKILNDSLLLFQTLDLTRIDRGRKGLPHEPSELLLEGGHIRLNEIFLKRGSEIILEKNSDGEIVIEIIQDSTKANFDLSGVRINTSEIDSILGTESEPVIMDCFFGPDPKLYLRTCSSCNSKPLFKNARIDSIEMLSKEAVSDDQISSILSGRIENGCGKNDTIAEDEFLKIEGMNNALFTLINQENSLTIQLKGKAKSIRKGFPSHDTVWLNQNWIEYTWCQNKIIFFLALVFWLVVLFLLMRNVWIIWRLN